MAKLSLPQRNGMLPYRQESVEGVVPVYNEQEALLKSIPALCAYLETYFPFRWSVLIADNASTDATLAVAEGLAFADPRVSVLHLEEKGRGRALKAAWLASEAEREPRVCRRAKSSRSYLQIRQSRRWES